MGMAPHRQVVELVTQQEPFFYEPDEVSIMKNQFIEIPANPKSLAKRKPLFGKAINDASYLVYPRIDGVIHRCKFYTSWSRMIKRCYDPKYHAVQPTYKDCSVCDEWLSFSNFKKWMEAQDWLGMDLDKDIKNKGNKLYSSDNCLFIPPSLNTLLNDHASTRGEYPLGVYLDKRSGKYTAAVRLQGRTKHLGRFVTPDEAHHAYILEKNKEIERQAALYPQWSEYILQHKIGVR